jgi:hypothetical protein
LPTKKEQNLATLEGGKGSLKAKIAILQNYITRFATLFDSAYDQIKDMDSQTASNLHLSESNTKEFEALRDAYRNFIKASKNTQSQAMFHLTESFNNYCKSFDKYSKNIPMFSEEISYFTIAKIVFEHRMQELKTRIKERNTLFFSAFPPTHEIKSDDFDGE